MTPPAAPSARGPVAEPLCGPRGGALPWALLALCLLLALAGAGFSLVWQEGRMSRAHDASVQAFYAAEAGRADFLARWTGSAPPPAGRIVLPSGSAVVEAVALPGPRPGLTLHRVRSTGAATGAGGPRRQVQQVVLAATGPRPAAALTVGQGFRGSAGAGTVDGRAAGPVTSCPLPAAVAGLARPRGGAPPAATVTLSGSPPLLALPSPADPGRLTGTDWRHLLSGSASAPDATADARGTWPAGGGGTGAPWPLVRAVTDPIPLGPAHSGRGVLLVPGDAEVGGGFRWRGLILVGGMLRIRGRVDVDGAVVVGLEVGRPGAGLVELAGGDLAIRWAPCAVAAAGNRIAPPPVPVPGTWAERFLF